MKVLTENAMIVVADLTESVPESVRVCEFCFKPLTVGNARLVILKCDAKPQDWRDRLDVAYSRHITCE